VGSVAHLSGDWYMDDVIVIVNEEDVFWLEIRMDEAEVMEDWRKRLAIKRDHRSVITYKPHCQIVVWQSLGCGGEERGQTRFPSRSHKHTCLEARRLGICDSGGRTNLKGGCIC
jgi:hypothetical protein